jgi:Asp-tRNA(Asn)/Glu-tRNA(Gln) amidotransferase A subunit family amidase
MPRDGRGTRTSRRTFLRTIPAAAVAGVSVPLAASRQTTAEATSISKATLKCAEELIGDAFTESEEDQMVSAVNTRRTHVESLRRVVMPPDTEPAFSFRPPLPLDMRQRGQGKEGAMRPRRRKAASPFPRVEVRQPIETLAFLPVTSLAALIRSRQVSSMDLTRMYLSRLKTHGKALEAVVTLTEDLALEQAARADREIAAGRYRGPLHGMPWGVKDLFATRGIPTTWGAKPYEHQVIDIDATVVERLREAGAVLLAKLATGELAGGDVWFGGRTRNPWNAERGSGGSSAGPAAAAAGGLVAFTIGTATGASIIEPASICGVVGLQPTYGRVSRYGVMTLVWTLDKPGPICRSPEDCMIVLAAIAGPDSRDDTVANVPIKWDPHAPVNHLRIGYVARAFEEPPPQASEDDRKRWPARKIVLKSAVEVFRRIGSRFGPVELPDLPVQAVFALLMAEGAASFDELVRSGAATQLASRGNGLRASRFIPAVEYIRAQRVRTLLVRQMNALFERFDVLLAPPDLPTVRMTNLSGHPAITVKAGFVDGLPEGIMLAGRLYDEGTIARVALAYEQATDWKDRHPLLS